MKNNSADDLVKIKWHYIVIFYIVAFTLSSFVNSGFLTKYYQTLTGDFFIHDFPYLPACLGTLMAALLMFLIDRTLKRSITIFGNYPFKNIVISITPLLVFTIIGLDNTFQLNRHFYALLFAAVNLLYAVCEEIGWRGYLQDALRPLSIKHRYFIVGLMWWAWHFRFTSTFDFTIFLVICIGGSFMIGQFTEKTHSYFTAGGLHSLIILLSNSGEMRIEKWIALVMIVGIWLSIGKWWNPEKIDGSQ